jgi:hypothetical protein
VCGREKEVANKRASTLANALVAHRFAPECLISASH